MPKTMMVGSMVGMTNAATIADLTGLPCLGALPHAARPEDVGAALTLPVE